MYIPHPKLFPPKEIFLRLALKIKECIATEEFITMKSQVLRNKVSLLRADHIG